jgi:hypothetical protein
METCKALQNSHGHAKGFLLNLWTIWASVLKKVRHHCSVQLVPVFLSRGLSGVRVKLTTHLFPLLRLWMSDAACTSASHFCRQGVNGKDFNFVCCSRYMRSSDTDAFEEVEMWKALGRHANKLKMDKETPGCILTEALSITSRWRNIDSQLEVYTWKVKEITVLGLYDRASWQIPCK